jgi:putative acetyltransferase
MMVEDAAVLARLDDGLIITTFVPAWRNDFARLNIAWLEKFFRVEPIDREVLGAPETHILQQGGEILFLAREDEVIGTVALKVEAPGVYELTKMAVTEGQQGRGHGQRLLAAALQLARSRGAHRVILYSQRSLAAAIAVYRKAGFRERPRSSPPRYARCDIEMEIELGSGESEQQSAGSRVG